MGNLKHILIYEAFASKTISKTLSFIGKQIGDGAKARFLNALKYTKDQYDYPIDKIDDKYIDYLTKKDAVLVNTDKQVDNKFGIFCLKFWFSVENGYLGFTGVGNKKIQYTKNSTNEPLDDKEISHILKYDILPNKGKLIPVKKNSELNHLDTVIFYYGGFIKGVIWKEYDKIYAIQNKEEGSEPSSDDWEEYGKYSWRLGNEKIHKYVEDDLPLRVIIESGKTSIFDYNLQIGSDGELVSWHRVGNGTGIIDEADFCVVLYFDDMLKEVNNIDIPSHKSKVRKDSRSGSTALMSNDEIKNANIERYISEMIKKIGISNNELTLKNLQKFVLMILNNKFALISCRDGFIYKIDTFTKRLSDLMYYHENVGQVGQMNNTDIEKAYKKCFNSYKEIYKEASVKITKSRNGTYRILNYYKDNQDMLNIINKTLSIGEKISDNISKYPTGSITDLKIIYHKLMSIRVITNGDDDDFYMGTVEEAFRALEVDNFESAIYYFNKINNEPRIMRDAKKSLNNIERYVDSIFK